MIGARCPVERQQQIQDIAKAAGSKEVEVVREAIAQYSGKTDPSSVKGALAELQSRLATVERKLARLGQLAR